MQAAHKTDGFLIASQTDNKTRTFRNEQLPLDAWQGSGFMVKSISCNFQINGFLKLALDSCVKNASVHKEETAQREIDFAPLARPWISGVCLV